MYSDTSSIRLNLFYWDEGFHKQIKVDDDSLCFVLKGILRIEMEHGSLLINSNIGGNIFTIKSKTNAIVSIINSTVIFIFSFKRPLFIMGKQPILYLAKISSGNKNNKMYTLTIKPLLSDFLTFITTSIREDIKCGQFEEWTSGWMFSLLKNLYSKAELCSLFSPFFENIYEDFRLYIQYNYKKYYSVKALAKAGHYSLTDFKRKFKIEFGESPGKWMNDRRKQGILKAIKAGDNTCEQISIEYKFASLDYFQKYCKREFGFSAKEICMNRGIIKNK